MRWPPAPDDRLWRHPSEIGPKPPSPARQLWVVGLASALAASLLSTGLAVVAGSLLDAGGRSRGVDTAGVVPVPSLVGTRADIVSVAERVRPAIAQLKVERGRSGSGSAVFFRSDGYLLTNAHVVDGASSVTVVLATGRELPAQVVGSDAGSDTAVVKVDGGGSFPVAELGSSQDLKVGQDAIAIGSPLGLSGGPSVTVGVISALHRTVRTRTGTSLSDMVQTDAPIAPGSSGGALVDGNGRVIGITTAMAMTDTGADGFGFATPIDSARSVAEQLLTTGKVVTVWLGVEGGDLDGATARSLKVEGGALVEQVKSDSPAARAGLAPRDVIVGVNGQPVTSMGMLVIAVRAHRPGDVCTLDIVRDNQHHGMKVTLAERPAGS